MFQERVAPHKRLPLEELGLPVTAYLSHHGPVQTVA